MKTVRSSKPQLHADVQSMEMNASILWFTRLEIRFWQTVTPLMQQSPMLRLVIRFSYNLISGKPFMWVVGISALFALIMFALGFIIGLVYPLLAGF